MTGVTDGQTDRQMEPPLEISRSNDPR